MKLNLPVTQREYDYPGHEMLVSTTSERQGRMIDRDQAGSMELKKRQGYF